MFVQARTTVTGCVCSGENYGNWVCLFRRELRYLDVFVQARTTVTGCICSGENYDNWVCLFRRELR